MSGTALQRKVLEDKPQSPAYPPPSKPWPLMSPVGTNPSPGFFSGVTPLLTGNLTPRAPVTSPPFVNPSPGVFSGNALAPTGNRTPRLPVRSPPFVPQNVSGAENQQHKKPTQGNYDVAQKKDECVFPSTPPKTDEKPSPPEESDHSDGAQLKDLRKD